MSEVFRQDVISILRRYVNNRFPAGNGFRELLTKDINPRCLDSEMRQNLAEVLEIIQKEVPEEARGSVEAYNRWIGGKK